MNAILLYWRKLSWHKYAWQRLSRIPCAMGGVFCKKFFSHSLHKNQQGKEEA
jgi:hypothetical protein